MNSSDKMMQNPYNLFSEQERTLLARNILENTDALRNSRNGSCNPPPGSNIHPHARQYDLLSFTRKKSTLKSKHSSSLKHKKGHNRASRQEKGQVGDHKRKVKKGDKTAKRKREYRRLHKANSSTKTSEKLTSSMFRDTNKIQKSLSPDMSGALGGLGLPHTDLIKNLIGSSQDRGELDPDLVQAGYQTLYRTDKSSLSALKNHFTQNGQFYFSKKKKKISKENYRSAKEIIDPFISNNNGSALYAARSSDKLSHFNSIEPENSSVDKLQPMFQTRKRKIGGNFRLDKCRKKYVGLSKMDLIKTLLNRDQEIRILKTIPEGGIRNSGGGIGHTKKRRRKSKKLKTLNLKKIYDDPSMLDHSIHNRRTYTGNRGLRSSSQKRKTAATSLNSSKKTKGVVNPRIVRGLQKIKEEFYHLLDSNAHLMTDLVKVTKEY